MRTSRSGAVGLAAATSAVLVFAGPLGPAYATVTVPVPTALTGRRGLSWWLVRVVPGSGCRFVRGREGQQVATLLSTNGVPDSDPEVWPLL